MIKEMSKTIIIILLHVIFCQAQDYYGIRYAESSMIIDALDPVYGRQTTKQIRLGELFNARLWRWGPKLQKEPDLVISLPTPPGMGMELDAVYAELKPNLKWPDGVPITVDDIIFSLDLYRECESSFEKSIAEEILCEAIGGSITKFKLKPSDTRYNRNFFKNVLLDIPSLQILPKHLFSVLPVIVRNSPFSKEPSGAGPFKISEISRDGNRVKITLLRNEYHHFDEPIQMIREVALDTEPMAQRMISGLTISDKKSYENGINYGYDLIVEPIASRTANTILELIPHIESETYANNSWVGIGLNVNKGILRSVNFRIILDNMLDNKKFIENNYERGQARVVTGPFIQDFGIYKKELKDRVATETDINTELITDLNCNKESDGLLYCLNTETGKREKIIFKLIYKDNFAKDGSCEAVALRKIIRKFREFGITVNAYKLDPKIYYDKLKDKNYWDLFYVQHQFDFQNNVTPLFYENNPNNYTGYHNVVLTGHMDTYQEDKKGPIHTQAGKNIHQHCYDNVPYLFLWHVKPKSWKRKILKNMSITPDYYFTTIHKWEITPRK